MKNIKKLLLFALLCTLSICLFISGKTIKVKADMIYDFANITEEQSLEFLEDHNIEIPAIFSGNREQIGDFAKNIMQITYSNPTYEYVFNYDKTLNFANDIKQAVLPYVREQTVSPQSCSPYYLQYNKVKNSNGEWVTRGGAWDNRWENYNCYAFSIGRNEEDPFYYSPIFQYQPGEMSGPDRFEREGSIEKLANLIKKDIEAMGYNNVALSTTIPSITNNQSLICVRKNDYDYHFMKYDLATNAWYHKPGPSAVLKYNGIPNNSEIWYGEISKYGIESRNINDYDSDIYFIKYDKNIVNVSLGTSNLTKNVHVNAGKDTILEIKNITERNYYYFNVVSTKNYNAILYYDDMFFIISFSGINNQLIKQLSTEAYFLKFNFIDTSAAGDITVTISAHNHQYTYASISSGHLASCGCGYTENQPHTYIGSESLGETQHRAVCVCGATTVANHDYTNNYEIASTPSQHIAYCACGASKTENHAYSKRYIWIDGYSHNAFCGCGAATVNGHYIKSGSKPPHRCMYCKGIAEAGFSEYRITIPIGATQITKNGSYVLPNGITIVAEADLEDFLNGTPKLLKHNLVLSA